jgi:hypothetical protein
MEIDPYVVFSVIFGPRPDPYLPSRCESPESVEVFFNVSDSNSESMSPRWQSAKISKLDASGKVKVIAAEEFVI